MKKLIEWIRKHKKFFEFLIGAGCIYMAWNMLCIGLYGLYVASDHDEKKAIAFLGALIAFWIAKSFWLYSEKIVMKYLKKDINNTYGNSENHW